MTPEFKVLQVTELVGVPSIWQSGVAREKEFAAGLQEALNRMGKEGWIFVGSHTPTVLGSNLASGFLIFRREQ